MPSDKIKIIITSAGTASAISVIKALRAQTEIPVHIIAVDLDPMAAGLFLADEYKIVPPASDPAYISSLVSIGAQTGASVLIPIYSKEISIISKNQSILKKEGLHTFLPDSDVIELCNNKRKMNNVAQDAGLKVPKVFETIDLAEINEKSFPVFIKPNSGSSSMGAERVFNKERLAELLKSGKDLIVQEFIDAQEVTVDVFCNEQSEAVVVAPRLRLATKSGQSVKGRTLSADLFLEPVKAICKQLSIKGVCNVQFFIKEEGLYFIELNPRFAAGGLMLTVGAGANIPLILLKTILKKEISEAECRTKSNYLMTRYWEEIVYHA